MTVTAVVGAQWGDEGKGRVVDYLAQRARVVVRFQGGDNAGHTVKNDLGEFVLHTVGHFQSRDDLHCGGWHCGESDSQKFPCSRMLGWLSIICCLIAVLKSFCPIIRCWMH